MSDTPVVEMRGIVKCFGGHRALDGVDFSVNAGEVHALIGENGAGKSTLMNVLAGRFSDYSGEVRIQGALKHLSDPRQALALGIGVIYQESSVLPNLTVAENILLGHEPNGKLPASLDRGALKAEAQKTLDYLGYALPVDAEVSQLSAARQVLVEIARAVRRKACLLVFDEPTASLGNEDVTRLFQTIRDLKARGMGIVYISHRLAELPQIADHVTVLRDGQVAGTRRMNECKVSDLTRLMLGRDLTEVFPPRQASNKAEVLLRVTTLTRRGVFENVSFDLHAGEILGLAGLVGSGRTEIVRAVVGADRSAGTVELGGKALPRRTPQACRRLGLCLVPEDRKRDGNITGRPIVENINAGILEQLSGALGFLSPKRCRAQADQMIRRMEVDPPLPAMEIQKLSGGNQQKVIVGRVLAVQPKVLIFDEPTQGIDVGTKAQIYRLITELAASGCGIILVSSEFIELTELAHRILVVREGRITREIDGRGVDEEALFAACVGNGQVLAAGA
ncbi:MAG TPA: sugar ABC transporter ATP-binding protein [Planctomycetota bacterium]